MKTLLALLLLIPSLSWGTELICTHQHVSDDANLTFWKLDLYEDKLILKKAVLDNGKEINNIVEHSLYDFQNNIVKSFKDTSSGRIEVYLNIKTGAMSNSFNDWPVSCEVLEEQININSVSGSEDKKMENYKNQCKSIGYTPNTEKFADCVMKLYSDNSNSNKSGQISNNNSQSDYMKKQNELLEQQNRIQQNQLELQKKQHNQKVWNDFMDAINPKPKLNCRKVGWNTVCY